MANRKSDECERAQGDKLCLVSQKYFLDLEKHPSPKKCLETSLIQERAHNVMIHGLLVIGGTFNTCHVILGCRLNIFRITWPNDESPFIIQVIFIE